MEQERGGIPIKDVASSIDTVDNWCLILQSILKDNVKHALEIPLRARGWISILQLLSVTG
jgi:hypothetical protein